MVMMKATRSTELHVGRKRAVLAEELALEGGEVIAAIRTTEEDSFLSVPVPGGTSVVKSCQKWESRKPGEVGCPYCGKGRGTFLLCVPEEGRIALSENRYFYIKPVLRKAVDGEKWKVALSRFHWDAAEGASLDRPVEPLVIAMEIEREGDTVKFTPSFKDASGRLVEVYRNGERIVPRLRVRKTGGEEIGIFDFSYR
ncbi:MAG: hypothetical protein ACYTHM_25675 [Planctomycetota bacterium]|jgi:hypothetical protein